MQPPCRVRSTVPGSVQTAVGGTVNLELRDHGRLPTEVTCRWN